MNKAPTLTVLLALCGCASAVIPEASDAGRDAVDAGCGASLCDPRNCGGCGVVCASGQVCGAGVCRAPAPAVQWARQLHTGIGGVSAVTFDGAGNLAVGGSVRGSADLGTGPLAGGTGADPVLALYEPSGVPRWTRRFASASVGEGGGYSSLSLDPAGALWTAGSFAYSVPLGGEALRAGSFLGGFVASYAPDGRYRFGLPFTNPPDRPQGSSPDNRLVTVGATADGDGIVGGYVEGPAVFGTHSLPIAPLQGVVARVGPAGEVRWLRTLGGSSASTVRALAVYGEGESLVAGIFEGVAPWGGTGASAGGFDTVVARLDAQGQTRWAVTFGGQGDDLSEAIALDREGNVYVTGSTGGNLLVGEMHPTGAGIFLVALDRDGAPRWARVFAAEGAQTAVTGGHGVAVDAAGNVAVAGGFVHALTLDGHRLGAGSSNDGQGFAALYSGAGEFLWAQAFSSSGAFNVGAVAADGCGGLALGGSFAQRVDLGATTLAVSGSYDGWFARLQE